jgi:hypothetical protein
MKTLVSTTAVVADDLRQPTVMTEAETDRVGGGAPNGDRGNAYGAGHGWGINGHGNGKGQGWDNNNSNGRF